MKYEHGDVLTTHTGGRVRYVRILGKDVFYKPNHEYVQDCDGAGFLLSGTPRPLHTSTLDSRYRLHYRAEEAS